MRWSAMGLIALSLAGCAGYKAEGPVLDNWNRVRGWSDSELSRARYIGQPAIAAPVVPVLAFGAHLDLDVLMRPVHERWHQQQVGRMDTPAGPLWVALEAPKDSKEHILLADLPEIDALMPELPFVRRQSSFKVADKSSEESVNVDVTYTNSDGDVVALHVESDPPFKAQRKRNAPLFEDVRDPVIGVVDVPARESAFDLDLRIDGKAAGMKRSGGIVPFQYVTTQTYGGMAVGSFTVAPGQSFSFDSTMPQVVVRVPDAPETVVATSEPATVSRPDPLTSAMRTQEEQIQGCWTTSAKVKPGLSGQVLLSFQVNAGKAEGVSVVRNTTEDEALALCLTEKVGGIAFPDTVAGDVGFPFEFAAEGGLVLAASPSEGGEDLPEAELPEAELSETVAAPMMGVGAGAEEGEAVPDDPEDPDAPATVDRPVDPAYGGTLAHFETIHAMPSGNTVTLGWDVSRKGERVYAVQHTDVRTLTYEYLLHHDALELTRITVAQYGHAAPVTTVSFSPALPDLRRPFDTKQTSRYVIDVNGQESYAVGSAEAYWTESGVKLKLVPEAPEWNVGDALVTTIAYSGGQAAVTTQLTE